MAEHYELVQEMMSIERMATQDRLKHARKRRVNQLKKWGQYDKQWEKDTHKKSKKKQEVQQTSQRRPGKRKIDERVRFKANIALLESAARSDIEEVKKMLQGGVSPDVTNEDGLTALHQCCIDDNEEMLKILLEYSANVNACDSELWTPLHAAATCGHVSLCKHLIDSGAELLAVNADGNMPYDICEDEVTLDYIETEMAKRDITQEQIDATRLTTERQMLNDLKDFSASGGDLEVKDATGASFLHIAAAQGFIDVVDFLLDHHVSVDTRDPELWQPIHAASYWGQMEILEMLVQNGADLDSKTKGGEAPFDLCEDPDIKQRILDMKDEIETNKASRHRPGSNRKHKANSRNASMRKSSVRGEKATLFKKEAQEEALHFGLRMMQDEEDLMEIEEEKETLPATNIDDVTISFGDDLDHPKHPPSVNHKEHRQTSPRSDHSPRNHHTEPAPIGSLRGKPNAAEPPSTPSPRTGNGHNPHRNPPPPQSYSDEDEDKDDRERDPNPRRDAVDAHLQSMFLDSVPGARRGPAPPARGQAPPARGQAPPARGQAPPARGQAPPARGQAPPARGQAPPVRGQAPPPRGQAPSPRGPAPPPQPPQPQQTRIYPPPMMERGKNGHNNNNNGVNSSSTPGTTNNSTAGTNNVTYEYGKDGQMRRFVSPPTEPVIGGVEEKQSCCVIL